MHSCYKALRGFVIMALLPLHAQNIEPSSSNKDLSDLGAAPQLENANLADLSKLGGIPDSNQLLQQLRSARLNSGRPLQLGQHSKDLGKDLSQPEPLLQALPKIEKAEQKTQTPKTVAKPSELQAEPIDSLATADLQLAQEKTERTTNGSKQQAKDQSPELGKPASKASFQPSVANSKPISALQGTPLQNSSAQQSYSSPPPAKTGLQANISKHVDLASSFQLTLHGLTWTFIPALSEFPSEPKFERHLGDSETSFKFDFRKAGRYLLTFSRQYPSTGKLSYYSAEVIVSQAKATDMATGLEQEASLPLELQAAAPALGGEQIFSKSAEPSNISLRITSQVINDVRQQLSAGELDSAYQTLSSWPQEERGDIFETAATAFYQAGMYTEAAEMWQHNTSLDGELGEQATVGLLKAAAKAGNTALVNRWLNPFLKLAPEASQQGLVSREDFAELYEFISAHERKSSAQNPNADTASTVSSLPDSVSSSVSSQPDLAQSTVLDFYQTYIDVFPGKTSPKLIYHMAQTYEKPSKVQDLSKARNLYTDIIKTYPVDRYSGLAQERLDFLNRQFFYVR